MFAFGQVVEAMVPAPLIVIARQVEVPCVPRGSMLVKEMEEVGVLLPIASLVLPSPAKNTTELVVSDGLIFIRSTGRFVDETTA